MAEIAAETSTAPGRVERMRGWFLLAGALCAIGAAYAPAVGGDFHWDDDLAVLTNPTVVDPGRIGVADFLPPVLGRNRTLTDLTFALNHALSGNANAPYVVTNVAIHLLVVVLVFLLASALLRRVGHPRGDGVALAVAVIFGLHPLQTEAVSFVCQRSESLASLFYVAALLAFLEAEERHPARHWGGWAAAGGVAFFAAVSSKGMALTLPIVGLLTVALTGPRREHGRRYWIVAWGLPLLAALLLAAGTVVGLSGQKDAGLDAGDLGPWRYLLTEASVILRYVWLLLWPPDQSVDHWVRGSPGLGDPLTLASGALILAALGGAVWLARAGLRAGGKGEARIAALGVLWYLLILAPTSSLVPLSDPMAEHRVYLANFGLILAAAVAIDWALVRARGARAGGRAGGALALLLALALGAALVARNRLWHDELALWTDAAAKAPLHYRPQLHAGNALWGRGRTHEALPYYSRAAALVPPRSSVWEVVQRSLANGLTSLGRFAEAREVLERAVSLAPDQPGLRESLAWVRFTEGDFEGALGEVARGRMRGMNSAELAAVAGKTAANRGDLDTALRELRLAVQLAPYSAQRRADLAIASSMAGRTPDACEQIARFIALEKEGAARAEGEKLQRQWRCPVP